MTELRSGVRMSALAVLCGAAVLAAGCNPPAVTFPAEPVLNTPAAVGYDTRGDGKPHFFLLANECGRVDRIGYDDDCDGKPDRIVHLDAIDSNRCRSLVIVLDGFPYDVVEEFYRQGHLRLFHPPQVMIAAYPSLTDLCLEDVFGYVPTPGFEAKYYDRAKNQETGGTSAYVSGKGEPFAHTIEYRASFIDDGLAYLCPKPIFEKEINASKRTWDGPGKMESIYYYVSTAAVGTRLGKEGHRLVLGRVEQLVNQIYYETGGLVKVTMLADHGQTCIPCKDAQLDKFLACKGWKNTGKVRADNEVCVDKFGLETYAAIETHNPAKLTDDLLTCQAVELVSYAECDSVVVRTRDGRATIRSCDGKNFEYVCQQGDPLKLNGLLASAPASQPATTSAPAGGCIVNGRQFFDVSVRQRAYYPDALYRLWRAHFALAENPARVIVSLDDHFFNGDTTFSGAVDICSTHGALNWRNSATFIMSTAGPVECPIRNEDVPAVMQKLFCRPFPYRR